MLKVGVLGNMRGKRTGFYIATKLNIWLAFNLDKPGWSLRIGQRWFGNSGIVYIAKADRWLAKRLAKRKDRTES